MGSDYIMEAMYGVLSAMVAYHALIGKVNGFQLMWVGFIFSLFWFLNYALIGTVYYAATLGYLDIVYTKGCAEDVDDVEVAKGSSVVDSADQSIVEEPKE
eukprot:TRINITY_DN75315_c0_g1_i1.p2 TRINITY_DN75315_c0_g1~~TRINITY_DN75315_c0_g1_i1.p2  ORF type:complete len:100 (-),score=10.37 TRINITY_DN75315_c0_g1_i1:158-457(-)